MWLTDRSEIGYIHDNYSETHDKSGFWKILEKHCKDKELDIAVVDGSKHDTSYLDLVTSNDDISKLIAKVLKLDEVRVTFERRESLTLNRTGIVLSDVNVIRMECSVPHMLETPVLRHFNIMPSYSNVDKLRQLDKEFVAGDFYATS